jgi:hypothetical protein
MKKVLLLQDEAAIISTNLQILALCNRVGEFQKHLNELPPLGKLCNSTADLVRALAGDSPSAYVRQFIKELLPTHEAGVPVDRDARMATLKIPDMKELDREGNRLKQDLAMYGTSLQAFKLEATGVTYDSKQLEQLLDRKCRVYATTKEEEKAYELINNVVDAYSRFKNWYEQKTGDTSTFSIQNMDSRQFFDVKDGELVASVKFFNHIVTKIN